MLNEAGRQRAMRESVAIDIEARKLIQPLAKQLEQWNRRIAYFKGLELRYQRGRSAPDMRQPIAELTIEVETGFVAFHQALNTVPVKVLRCGRIQDIERIFRRMMQLLLELAG